MDLNVVFENNEKWLEEKLKKDKDYFKKLGQGQSPKLLYIGCSDSRVIAEDLMGLGPGEVFVHRNIANLVVSIDLNAMSVINYAVNHLNINHIVVCGHYACTGIKAAMQSKDMGILNPWLRNVLDVYKKHRIELDAIIDRDKRYDRLVELNVLEQCTNIIKIADVQRAHKERGLKIYGWVFNVHSGKLIDLKIDFDEVRNRISSVYHLDLS
jgi:carbonic anhydrase